MSRDYTTALQPGDRARLHLKKKKKRKKEKENIGKNLHSIGFSYVFSNNTAKTQAAK